MQVTQALHSFAASDQEFLCLLFPTSLQVLAAARDAIHQGWLLLHHPLYGNYRPHQQPYRSMLLKNPPAARAGQASPDLESLHFIEEALLVYSSGPVLTPDKAPPSLRDACTLLDFDLMRLPLSQALPGRGPELTCTCA